jgi:hypothetical protein
MTKKVMAEALYLSAPGCAHLLDHSIQHLPSKLKIGDRNALVVAVRRGLK